MLGWGLETGSAVLGWLEGGQVQVAKPQTTREIQCTFLNYSMFVVYKVPGQIL